MVGGRVTRENPNYTPPSLYEMIFGRSNSTGGVVGMALQRGYFGAFIPSLIARATSRRTEFTESGLSNRIPQADGTLRRLTYGSNSFAITTGGNLSEVQSLLNLNTVMAALISGDLTAELSAAQLTIQIKVAHGGRSDWLFVPFIAACVAGGTWSTYESSTQFPDCIGGAIDVAYSYLPLPEIRYSPFRESQNAATDEFICDFDITKLLNNLLKRLTKEQFEGETSYPIITIGGVLLGAADSVVYTVNSWINGNVRIKNADVAVIL